MGRGSTQRHTQSHQRGSALDTQAALILVGASSIHTRVSPPSYLGPLHTVSLEELLAAWFGKQEDGVCVWGGGKMVTYKLGRQMR